MMHKPISRNTWYSLFKNEDSHPHYLVEGKVFYSKFDAMLAAKDVCAKTGKHVYDAMHFRCFDRRLGLLDFSREPESSYQDLCKQRAKQLRNKYSYIRLWYSGGVDSHTTLMSFYRAGIAPDEICFMSNKSWDSKDHGANIEYDLLSIPMQDAIRQMFPSSKQRVILFHYDFWKTLDTTNIDDYLYKACLSYPLGRDIPTAFEIDKTLMDAVDVHGHGLCELTGEPKIYMFKKNGLWYTYLSDFQMMNMIAVPNIELFHLSPDFPEIYIKQCHMVKRGFESMMINKEDSHSLELDKDVFIKNRFMERQNEFDLQRINAIDTNLMKYKNNQGDRFSVLLNASLMKKQDHTSRLFNRFGRIFNKDLPHSLSGFVVDDEATYKDTIPFRASAYCLDKKHNLPMNLMWKKGFGNYDG